MLGLIERNRTGRIGALVGVALLTIFIYHGGLHGPFLIDDIPNLDTIQRWVEGRLNWRSALDNRSGPLGRPVSMLTFLMDAARTGGMYPAAFKSTNLAIHIVCGLLAYVFCRQIFLRVEATRNIAATTALFVATWWLFLPLHVSTVLYIVQRMAQLSALFILLTLIAYIAIRRRMERSANLSLTILLWTVVPITAAIGSFAKENAVLALPLALLVELTLFSRKSDAPRPRSVFAFFVVTVATPCLLAIIWLAIHPGIVTSGYQARPFTMSERLLTEPRVLWSYVQTMLLPVGEDMGLFHDTYGVSTGLLAPWTTLAAIAGWIGAIIAAVACRRRYPLITLGIGFFLIGHALESTIVPLEIYFEHRNYLPDLGVIIAITGVARAAWLGHASATLGFKRSLIAAIPIILAIYGLATWVQAGSWHDADTLFAMQESYNPTSPRLQSTLGARDIGLGNTSSALMHIGLAERFGPPEEHVTATFWRFIAYCTAKMPVPEALYIEFDQRASLPISTNSMRYWEELTKLVEDGCGDAKKLSAIGHRWIERDQGHNDAQVIWRSRYNLARIDATAGNLILAEADARQAWIDSDYSNGIAILLFQLNASLGRREACAAVLAELKRRRDPGNTDLTDAINIFSKALADGTIGEKQNPH